MQIKIENYNKLKQFQVNWSNIQYGVHTHALQ